MNTISLKKIAVAVVIINMGAGYVRANKQELLANLSKKQAEFEFKDVTISEALKEIGAELGVKIVLSDEAQWKLPQGEATRLSASLKGYLSDCLTEMLNAFLMRYAIDDNEITIYSRQELEHILGRPSTKQLELLKNIYAMKLSFDGSFSIEHARELISRALKDVSFLPYDTSQRISEIIKMRSTDKGMVPVSFAVLLQQVGDRHNMPRWYLSGMDFPGQAPVITMVNEEEFREAKLNQVVDISFKDETAVVILQRLAGWTGMDLLIDKKESPWLQEEISVNMQNIKLKQALINIVDSVDGRIDIHIGNNRIVIYEPVRPRVKESASEESKSVGGNGEGYVGKISIPMGEGEDKYYIEFMLREKDLTEELKKLREDKIKEILKKFSKAGNNTLEITFNSQPYTILN